jgi:hypothetical protein
MKKRFVILPLLAMMLIGGCVFAQNQIKNYASVLVRVNGNHLYFLVDYNDNNQDGIVDDIVTVDMDKDYPLFKDNTFYDLCKVTLNREPNDNAFIEIGLQEGCYMAASSRTMVDRFPFCAYAMGQMTCTDVRGKMYSMEQAKKVKNFIFPFPEKSSKKK